MTPKILLSGGCVLTLGAKTPNFTQADVLIDDGVVAQVGTGLRARDAERVDATDTIVMPGFVDAHVHYPQVDVMAAWGTQLLDWLHTHTFPAEQAFADGKGRGFSRQHCESSRTTTGSADPMIGKKRLWSP